MKLLIKTRVFFAKKNYYISLFLIFSTLFIISCQSDDTLGNEPQNNVQNFEAYHYRYMHYPNGIMPSINSDGIVKIEYDNQNRPIKRIGGLLATAPQTGFNYIFSPDVYNQITYGNSTATVISKYNSNQGMTISENKKYFEFENGRIIKKINVDSYNSGANDTIQFFYANDKVIRSLKRRNSPITETKYYYNSIGNVDSIVTRPFLQNPTNQTWAIDETVKYRTVQRFKNYDNSPNPTKKLMIFDEIFNRTLSENNYKSYESKTYDFNGNVLEFSTNNWTFNYINNQINFSN